MSDPTSTETESHPAKDELSLFVEGLEDAIAREDWPSAATLIEEDIAAAWFGL